jgi:hypothetical protein
VDATAGNELRGNLAEKCDLACAGDSKEECGGKSVMSVYETGYSTGCFKDDPQKPGFPHRAPKSAKIDTLTDCRRYCRGDSEKYSGLSSQYFEFAALKHVGLFKKLECRCGDSYGSRGLAAPGSCLKCSSNANLECGGVVGPPHSRVMEATSVYRTGPQTACSGEIADGGEAKLSCPKLTRIEHVLFADFGSSLASAQDMRSEVAQEAEPTYGDCMDRVKFAHCGEVVTVECPTGTNLVSGGATGFGLQSSAPVSKDAWQCHFDEKVCKTTKDDQAKKCFARCCRYEQVSIGNQPTFMEEPAVLLTPLEHGAPPQFTHRAPSAPVVLSQARSKLPGEIVLAESCTVELYKTADDANSTSGEPIAEYTTGTILFNHYQAIPATDMALATVFKQSAGCDEVKYVGITEHPGMRLAVAEGVQGTISNDGMCLTAGVNGDATAVGMMTCSTELADTTQSFSYNALSGVIVHKEYCVELVPEATAARFGKVKMPYLSTVNRNL